MRKVRSTTEDFPKQRSSHETIYADPRTIVRGTSVKTSFTAGTLLVLLLTVGCASAGSSTAEPNSQTPPTPAADLDCSGDPEELKEACQDILDHVEDVRDDSISTTNVGGPCTAVPLNDELAVQLAKTMAAYEGIGAPEYHYSYKIRDDGMNVQFSNVYTAIDLGVEVSYLPRETMLRDITTFDKYAAWQADIDRPAEEIESGEYGWAAIQRTPSERVTYYQLTDDGQTNLMVEFGLGPFDLSATHATAKAMRDIICAGP